MKIINIKFNFKLVIIFICILIGILSIVFLKDVLKNSTIVLNNENYTSILKNVHDTPSNYIDKK